MKSSGRSFDSCSTIGVVLASRSAREGCVSRYRSICGGRLAERVRRDDENAIEPVTEHDFCIESGHRRGLWPVVLTLCAIAIVVSIRRLTTLAHPEAAGHSPAAG